MHTDDNILQFIHGGPMLEDVRLQATATWVCRPPLQTVNTLHLALEATAMEYDDYRQMISSCHLLSTLVIYDSTFLEWDWKNDPIDVPNLRSLQIYGSSSKFICEPSKILWALTSSKLEEFILAPVTRHDLYFLYDVQPTDSRLRNIKSLTMVPANEHCVDTISLAAEFFTGIERLTLPHVCSEERFTDEFNSEKMSGLWHRLRELTFNEIDENNESMLLSIAHSRKIAGKPLERILLDPLSYRRVQSSKSNILCGLQNAGVSVAESPRWDVFWPDGTSLRMGKYNWIGVHHSNFEAED
ncbi:hypothetical protein BDQ17DRAFT_1243638 [Cyathus striatus]|nr:hypothetical protein BDQ17DRAFT_1243638 [Cyathus striatus]